MEHGSAGFKQLVVWVLAMSALLALEAQAQGPPGSCVARDLDALLAFKEAVSDPAGQLGSWQSGGNCCGFKGVTCNAGGEVVQLVLEGINLTGSLPAIEEGELPALEVLRLQGNRFNGAVPPSLARLTSLRDLRLGGWQDNSTASSPPERSQLSGSIPLAFGNLTNLETLIIRLSSISGSIPPTLGSLKFLKVLQLDQNHLSGVIPYSLNVGQQQLSALLLNNNTLSGRIPDSLAGFPESSFAGNPSLYGPPLPP